MVAPKPIRLRMRIPRGVKVLAVVAGFAGVPAFMMLSLPAAVSDRLRPAKEAMKLRIQEAKPHVVAILSDIAGEPRPEPPKRK